MFAWIQRAFSSSQQIVEAHYGKTNLRIEYTSLLRLPPIYISTLKHGDTILAIGESSTFWDADREAWEKAAKLLAH